MGNIRKLPNVCGHTIKSLEIQLRIDNYRHHMENAKVSRTDIMQKKYEAKAAEFMERYEMFYMHCCEPPRGSPAYELIRPVGYREWLGMDKAKGILSWFNENWPYWYDDDIPVPPDVFRDLIPLSKIGRYEEILVTIKAILKRKRDGGTCAQVHEAWIAMLWCKVLHDPVCWHCVYAHGTAAAAHSVEDCLEILLELDSCEWDDSPAALTRVQEATARRLEVAAIEEAQMRDAAYLRKVKLFRNLWQTRFSG